MTRTLDNQLQRHLDRSARAAALQAEAEGLRTFEVQEVRRRTIQVRALDEDAARAAFRRISPTWAMPLDTELAVREVDDA